MQLKKTNSSGLVTFNIVGNYFENVEISTLGDKVYRTKTLIANVRGLSIEVILELAKW